jgi:hypothetical protein
MPFQTERPRAINPGIGGHGARLSLVRSTLTLRSSYGWRIVESGVLKFMGAARANTDARSSEVFIQRRYGHQQAHYEES